MDGQRSILLICTVGGSPEPIVAAIKYWRPHRIVFIHSHETLAAVERDIVPRAKDEGVELDPGRYDCFVVPDAEDFEKCVDRVRELDHRVGEWVGRRAGFQVVVDFTGGTKCMSAALAVLASRWPSRFSYVGGTQRNKTGIGVVVPGTERIVHSANPWDALGFQAADDFVALFDRGAFVAAAEVAKRARERASRPDRKRELSTLELLANACHAWERFDHGKAIQWLDDVEKGANDLRAVLGEERARGVLDEVRRLKDHLGKVRRADPPSRYHVVDLLANAKRRRAEGRHDDAVARLYRAIEAIAQVRLAEQHEVKTTEWVPLEKIPGSLRSRFEPRAEEGFVKIGLQDAYELLAAFGDPVGGMFREKGLDKRESWLGARNRSILAHGFESLSAKVSGPLWQTALDLAEIREDELPRVPRLSGTG